MFVEPEPLISIAVPLIVALLFDLTSIFIPSKATPFPDLPAILTPFVPDIVIASEVVILICFLLVMEIPDLDVSNLLPFSSSIIIPLPFSLIVILFLSLDLIIITLSLSSNSIVNFSLLTKAFFHF